MSLLLKADPLVSSLSLYDVRGAPGVAADISHVNTASTVKGFEKDDIGQALKGAEVVVIPAGVPRKPGMTRDDLFVRIDFTGGCDEVCEKRVGRAENVRERKRGGRRS
jgi:malate dehydrogenase